MPLPLTLSAGSNTGLILPYLHVTQSPFSTAHGAYESLEYTIARGVFPLLVLGIIYLTAVTVGRLFCGWACPFGLVQVHPAKIPIRAAIKTIHSSQELSSELDEDESFFNNSFHRIC